MALYLCRMNEHASLYEYWRSLLMEEQQNEERNNRLMRKLDEIEQRTSLLNERSERLKQLRENFSELIRQRYLTPDEMSSSYPPHGQPSKVSVLVSYVIHTLLTTLRHIFLPTNLPPECG